MGGGEGIRWESQGGGDTQLDLEIRDKFWCLACLHLVNLKYEAEISFCT
jgi:hypothetical protein